MIIINKKEKNIIYQISIFSLELLFIIGILTKVSLILFPLENIISWELIERIIGLYTAYQIFIYVTLTQIDDTEKDSYNTLKLLCEEALIYLNMKNENSDEKNKFKKYLYKSINAQMSIKAMNSEEIIKEYEQLLTAINERNRHFIEHLIVNCNHWLYHLDLRFTKSLFLRKFKNPSFKVKWKIITIIICITILIIIYTQI